MKAEETVTVGKDIQFESNTPEYKNGLRSIKTGDIGTVVNAATRRSVVVEFGGKRTTLGSQRLERIAAPVNSPATTLTKAPVNPPAAASQKTPESAAPTARKPAQEPQTVEKAPTPHFAEPAMRSDNFSTNVQALVVGPITIVALPGEPFVETGKAISDRLGTNAIVLGYSNDDVRYILPASAYQGDKYESLGTWLSPRAEAVLIDAAVEVAQKAMV